MGAAVGATASYLALPSYKSLYACISEMDKDQQEDIARKIKTRVGNGGILAVKELIRNGPQNAEWLMQQLRSNEK